MWHQHLLPALFPQIILAAASVLCLLLIAWKRNHAVVHLFTLLSLILALASLGKIYDATSVDGLFVIDGLGVFVEGVILIAVFFITIFSYPYFSQSLIEKEEYYVLLLLATLGATSMVISNHFVSFFLSLEILSVSLYTLIAYPKKMTASVEAGVKYLVLAAVSSAVLVFGLGLIYVETGQMSIAELGKLATGGMDANIWMIVGLGLVIAGLGFKLALVPFHLWTPDVYAGAPAPTSAFVATISKGSVFVFLWRLFDSVGTMSHAIQLIFVVIAIASMLIGNWLALLQQNLKRLLAYSSIANLGYLIVAFVASGETGLHAAIFFLVAYFICMLGAFGIISFLSEPAENGQQERLSLSSYTGLFWQKPGLAVLLALIMLSLAGIPLTAGFIGKFYVLLSGVYSTQWLLVIVLILSSVIGLFYYLRVVIQLFSRPEMPVSYPASPYAISTGLAFLVLFILLIWFGIAPGHLIDQISQMVHVIKG
ncbi:NADH dehydrogenase subunit N [Thermoflavifilum aggregans]|uniref:NADH-quinone oxidoreductase subunit N n=1 Tax=Thermoflavifilum aggregans TaxID=454188 RepID=A0A2M9CSQ8_9BACT|nr:NADH-quinone oxidoreductase subunit N [Thermoflavifilum aggregans]PJJ74972.1 NADH dehydrogenase subunit N [Thermoflavifilum aggregans]